MTDLAQRYGSPSPPRRPLVVTGVVLLVAAGLGWLVWAIFVHSSPAVSSQMVRYTVRGQHAAHATFQVVRRDRAVPVNCVLRATALDHSVVGELDVPVGAAEPADVTLTRSMRTERRATTVELVGCTAKGQSAPG